MHKPNSISDDGIEISQVHLVTCFIETQSQPDRQAGACPFRNPFVAAFYMLEVVCDYINEIKFNRFTAP
jgi:hypothetical protein